MGNDRSRLVPEVRADRNGRNTLRWIKAEASTSDAPSSLPEPSVQQQTVPPKEEQYALYSELRHAIREKSQRKNFARNMNVLERLQLRDNEDKRELYRLFGECIASTYSFETIETAYRALKEHGTDNAALLLADEANLETAYSFSVIFDSTPDEMKLMVHHALTSGERELAEKAVYGRRVQNLTQLIEMMDVLRELETPLQSGAL